ncbi:glycosyltransferase family 4 protein [Amycolatopsis rubida]|uniref:Glycosyltransferase family 4 protein n=2 Tax=Pseudonocardiaceae TaxID=2070 RepID=A0A1I5EPY8_9PSEU|nr:MULTISPECIES: glycosyltransferase family 4 protein [Amycolatopsis]MYW97089.1 glycosyltransferase [Amycolatopsis rubida]NEC62074.1 glycosyltransferase family 4 protein [Amycolatopsis rubida]OAP27309.1 GDP-mannose-dependent alpha-(1-6)-phosphatidylinositol monomannoside mannosyltransferase [Amycolatopsis sp. M39]SFO13081.1 Glycosyltransferase involved in cell wall bisynthesis [Amycolatopsis rubida]
MRIVVVNNFFPPRVGGSAHMSASLAAEYAAAGHEVLAITAAYGDAPAEEERDGYRVVRLPAVKMPQLGLSIDFDMTFASMRPGNWRRLWKLLNEFKPDAVHLHGQFFDLSWMVGIYARRRELPVLLTIHTLLTSENKMYGRVFRVLDAMLVNPVLKYLRPRFVILDKLGVDYCVERYGTSDDNSEYFPIAVDTGHFAKPVTKDVRAELEIGDAPLIVSLGHVIPLRNRLPLIEALPAILERHPGLRVVIVGRVYHDAFQQRAKELGVADALIVTGAVPKADVPAYFAAADIVTHDLNGGCGTASLEAMLSGTATIASVAEDNYPGIELHNGENILLVRPNDSEAVKSTVLSLLDDPKERARIAEREASMVRDNFGLDVVAEEHLRVLTKLVADN